MSATGTVIAEFERDWNDGSRYVVQTKDSPESPWRDKIRTERSAVAVVHAWTLVQGGVYESRVVDTGKDKEES